MKKPLLYGAAFMFVAWAVTSCESLSGCKICKTVTTDSLTGQVTEGSESEQCGADLVAFETKTPVTTGNLTTRYQCR